MASTCPMLANKYIWTTSNVFGISRYIHNVYVVVIANGFVFYLVLHFVWYYIYFTLLFKRTFWLHTLFYFSYSDLERLGGNFAFLSLIGNHLLEEVFEEDFLHLFFHEDRFFYFYQPTIDSSLKTSVNITEKISFVKKLILVRKSLLNEYLLIWISRITCFQE